MPSSVTFLIQENSNSSLEKNHMLEYSSDESDDQDQRIGKNQLSKSDDQGEAILLEMEENCRENVSFSSLIESPQKKPLDIDLFSPDELETNLPQPSSKSPIRTRQAMTSKIPIRMNSSSHSRSPTHSRQIPSSARNNGAFHFFTPKDDRKRLASSDDDDGEANQLKEEELKIKLKEQKKHGRKTGELLNQLHENYEELLEKYAQAENTIDQLRFQPKILGDNTPRSVTSEVNHSCSFPPSSFSFSISYILLNQPKLISLHYVQVVHIVQQQVHHYHLFDQLLQRRRQRRLLQHEKVKKNLFNCVSTYLTHVDFLRHLYKNQVD